MARIQENSRRVKVAITSSEMNALLIEPAKQAGFIDFNPTRVNVRTSSEGFEITFERVEAPE